MKVLTISNFECIEWCKFKHYAHRIPQITNAFGLYNNMELVGICTFGIPASHSLCIGICGEQHKDKVRELNRLCIDDSISCDNKNVASFFVSACIRRMNEPGGRILVSYADTSQNHIGYIYQATNWIYTGLSAKRTERYDINNPNKHSKTVIQAKNQEYQLLAVRERPQKHRYIYFTGTKKQKKIFKQSLKYKILPYPKGDSQRYDASYKPTVQGILF